VDTAAKWREVAFGPSLSVIQRRASRAFVSVSSVVNVFEQMTNSVFAGSRPATTSWNCTPSMFETKCTRSRGLQ
jgi:hypothetical protein